MHEPQMEGMTLLSSGMGDTGTRKRTWVLFAAVPLVPHFHRWSHHCWYF